MNADVVDKTQPAFPWRRWAGRCALFVVGAMAGLLLAELALRLIGLGYRRPTVSHPYRGIASQPHSVFDYAGEGRSQTIHFNSHGFRDIDRSPAKSAGVYRIAVLGDSYIEAPQVAVTDRVTEQLEAELNRRGVLAPLQVEVLNFGFSAYGTMQELQVLKQDVWQFHPDLVILAFLTGNDVQNNCRELQDERSRPYLELRAGEFQESSRRVSRSRREQLWRSGRAALEAGGPNHDCWGSGTRSDTSTSCVQSGRPKPSDTALPTDRRPVDLKPDWTRASTSLRRNLPGNTAGRSPRSYCVASIRSVSPMTLIGCSWFCRTESRPTPIGSCEKRFDRRWGSPRCSIPKNASRRRPAAMVIGFSVCRH